ncbi:hypothetical protein FIBSPDRAFT_879523, partial [Athelia psychrophila]
CTIPWSLSDNRNKPARQHLATHAHRLITMQHSFGRAPMTRSLVDGGIIQNQDDGDNLRDIPPPPILTGNAS